MTFSRKPMPPYQAHAHKLDASQVDEIAQLLAIAFENDSGLSQICNAEGKELNRRLHFMHVQKHIPHQLVCIWKQRIHKMWSCKNTLGIT